MAEQWFEGLLQTKLSVPVGPPALVPRPALLDHLEAGLHDEGCRLTLVSAPAGFGKTTLLSSWARESSASVGWLTLDGDDNDVARFLAYVVAALRSVAPQIGMQPPAPSHQLLTHLLNDIMTCFPAADRTRLCLILDDYHLIRSQQVHDALTYLIDHLPVQIHLVVSSRADPPLPIARLRGRGQLTEIRQADLSFSEEEARRFFNEVMAFDLSQPQVSALNARTEGWPVGLEMAALALRAARQQQREAAALVDSFSGSHRYVLDYLTEEVLQQQAPETQRFMLQTSILERLCAPLCDAVTGGDDSRTILQTLDEDNLFVVPLDEERRWYRYHHLFADLLRTRLHQTCPEEMGELHRRAARWHEAQGDFASAVQHRREAVAQGQAPAPLLPPRAAEPNGEELLEPLSERELEVLALVAGGLTNREIAQRLFISVTTVKWHTGNIYGKLGAGNRVQAVSKARSLGLLPTPA